MKPTRHRARTAALQALYQLDVQRAPAEVSVSEAMAPILAEDPLPDVGAAYARELVAGTWTARERYDDMISGVSDHWDLARMAVVDRNVLRLALHELLERPDVPVRVVFDEAIELGREFGDAETPHFVNGVLDAVWKRHPACRIARGSPDAPEEGAPRGSGGDLPDLHSAHGHGNGESA